MTWSRLSCWSLIAVCAAHGTAALAQSRGRSSYARNQMNQAIRNVQNDIKAVEQQLKTARQELNQSSQAFSLAQPAYKQSLSDMKAAKKTQAERIGPTVGLPDAIAAADSAKSAYEEAVSQALPDLKKSTAYQNAQQSLDQAETRLAAVRKESSSDGRKEHLSVATHNLQAARQAHHNMIDSHPSIKPLKESLLAAEKHLAEVRQQYGAAIKDDKKLKAAESAFRRNRITYSQAKAALMISEEKVTLLQERLAGDHMLIGR